MSVIADYLIVATLLGAALLGGVFFAFSSFVMKALAKVPPNAGISAMQSINVVVLNPAFLGLFMGTAVLSLLTIAVALLDWNTDTSVWLIAGAVSYLAGTFLVTIGGNVPLNNRLAEVSAVDKGAQEVWSHYLNRWTSLNTVRTIAACSASVFLMAGLLN